MTTLTDLEERLRRGLQAAGEALPASAHEPPRPMGRDADGDGDRDRPPARHGMPRHRRVVGAAALVVAGGLATAAVVAGSGTGSERPEVRSGAETTAPSTTTEPHVVRSTNGRVPGRAVVVGNQLRTYAPDGTRTSSVDLARFTDVRSASSDLDGGWVVCGRHPLTPAEAERARREAREEVADIPPEDVARIEAEAGVQLSELDGPTARDELVWYPAGGEPVVLDESALCSDDSVHVVDSADGPIAVVGTLDLGDPAGGRRYSAQAIVLATGEERELPVPDSSQLVRWSVTSDRLLTAGPDGFRLHDLATGDELPMAGIDAGAPSDVVLAPDGATVAVIAGAASGPTDVSVYDVATGEQRFTERLPMGAEGAQLSYDGTMLAYGNYYDGYGPFTVVDLASGARHTIDAHGVLL